MCSLKRKHAPLLCSVLKNDMVRMNCFLQQTEPRLRFAQQGWYFSAVPTQKGMLAPRIESALKLKTPTA